MKRIIIIILSFLVTSTIFGQIPQGVSYQAIAFNAGGTPVVNGNIGIRISILDNSSSGNLIYSESHIKMTNAQGLFNLNIGEGTPISGVFNLIDWAVNSKFLKVEIDPLGGTNYTIIGSNQLMSVPYAFYSENTNGENISALSSIATRSGSMLVVYTSTGGYGFAKNSSGINTWVNQGFSGTVIGAISSDSAIVIYTTTEAYGYSINSSGLASWIVVGLSSSPLGAISNGMNRIVVYTSSEAVGYGRSSSGSYTWLSQGLSGIPIGGSSSGNSIVVFTSTMAYGYARNSAGNNTWVGQGLSGTPLGIVPK